MAGSIRDTLDQIQQFQYNPSAIARASLQSLSDAYSGDLTVVDPSNPFISLVEMSAVMVAAAMEKNEVNTRKQYPQAAQTVDDLYLHMSDKDYVNRFAIPAEAQFTFVLPKDELINKMVLDASTGIRKVVIPRNTQFTIADTVFSMQYPIEIQQLQHGGLQVIYDTDQVSPLQALESNAISWELRRNGSTDYLAFSLSVQQVQIVSVISPINIAKTWSLVLQYIDQYNYARVYHENADGTWKELAITHTPQVFDVMSPTCVLKVDEVNKRLQCVIPQIYTVSGQLSRRIRVDLYTTKGVVNLDLSNYGMGDTAIVFQSWDTSDDKTYSAPLNTLTEKYAFCQDSVVGGQDELAFLDLRANVIDNTTGPNDIPITHVQIASALQRDGYELVTNVDNITNRTFLATKPLPDPTNTKLITAAGAMNATVSLSLNDLAQHAYAIDNATSVTLTPDALFKDVNGVMQLVSDVELETLNALSNEQKALIVTNGLYRYTPFHYVLDNSGSEFAVRPYYLDDPSVITKLFVSENATTQLQVGTGQYDIVRTVTGYKLRILTSSTDTFQALDDDVVFVQLAFTPQGENSQAFINGTLVGKDTTGKERYYEFDLSTTFDVEFDEALNTHYLQLSRFFMFTTEPRLTGAPLTTTFDIVYSTTQPMDTGWSSAEVDTMLGRFLLPANVVGITHEQLKVKFGDALDRLWARSRSVIDTIQYATWSVDVPAVYSSDVYQRDPVTGSAITIVDGKPTYTVLHHKGDPVLNDDGTPVYQFRAGDLRLDANSQPIPINERGMTRQIDFMLIEGVYKFGTDSSAVAYRSQLLSVLLGWLTQDLEQLESQVLEQTDLYFYPKQTVGSINVLNGSNLKTTIEAGQSLLLSLQVPPNVYTNETLKASLKSTAIKTISTALQQTTVERSQIVKQLLDLFGEDVYDAKLSGLGGTADMDIFTVLDASTRCSLRKKLVAQTDESLIVQEDLTVDFVQHGLTS
jgi:hypothetical protein